MSRRRPPNRRDSETTTITVGFDSFEAMVGFDDNGKPAEVFLSGAKIGSNLMAVLEDTSVILSICLQHGITASELAHSVSPNHASVIGAALELIMEYELR